MSIPLLHNRQSQTQWWANDRQTFAMTAQHSNIIASTCVLLVVYLLCHCNSSLCLYPLCKLWLFNNDSTLLFYVDIATKQRSGDHLFPFVNTSFLYQCLGHCNCWQQVIHFHMENILRKYFGYVIQILSYILKLYILLSNTSNDPAVSDN